MMNRRIVLASRPHGEPKAENFRLEETTIPSIGEEPIGEGQVLLKTIYLSLDPYMRGRMSDAPSYAPPVEVNDVMVGGTIAKVVQSNNSKFSVGDFVLSANGWQDYAVSDGEKLINLGKNPNHVSYYLGILGMPGFTAYMGLLDIGKPKAGETLVIAAATGPVGSVVGQIGKLKGCKVIGIAGGKEKCQFAVNELGFDHCIDHYSATFAQDLADVCPHGIDIYYENVGGKVLSAVIPLFNSCARMPVCGVIASYNATGLPDAPNELPFFMSTVLKNRMTVKGFIIFDDYPNDYPQFRQEMEEWVKQGKIKTREFSVKGLENAPETFRAMLKGDNFGKTLIVVDDAKA